MNCLSVCRGKKNLPRHFGHWFFILNYFLEALIGVMGVCLQFWLQSISEAQSWAQHKISSTGLDSVPRKQQGGNGDPGVCVRTHGPAGELCAAWTLISSSLQGWGFSLLQQWNLVCNATDTWRSWQKISCGARMTDCSVPALPLQSVVPKLWFKGLHRAILIFISIFNLFFPLLFWTNISLSLAVEWKIKSVILDLYVYCSKNSSTYWG